MCAIKKALLPGVSEIIIISALDLFLSPKNLLSSNYLQKEVFPSKKKIPQPNLKSFCYCLLSSPLKRLLYFLYIIKGHLLPKRLAACLCLNFLIKSLSRLKPEIKIKNYTISEKIFKISKKTNNH